MALPIKLNNDHIKFPRETSVYKERHRNFLLSITKYFHQDLNSSPYIIFCNSEKDASHGYLDE